MKEYTKIGQKGRVVVTLCSCGCSGECMRTIVPPGSLLKEALELARPTITGHTPGPIPIIKPSHMAVMARAAVTRACIDAIEAASTYAVMRVGTKEQRQELFRQTNRTF